MGVADPTAAAIRRATRQAQNEMVRLDGAALDELVALYQRAAEDIRAAIGAAAAAGGGQRVQLAHLRALLAQVDGVLEQLGQARTAVIDGAIAQAAELGVRPLTGPGLAATGRSALPVLDGAAALQAVDAAVNFTRTFRAADGLSLSDRLWRVDRGAREAVQRTIEQAVVQGWGADKAAAELLYRGQPVPAATVAAQGAADVRQVVRAADVLVDEASGPLAGTLRVMRTEINRAHGEAYMAGAAQAPGFVGFRFLLSPRHPRPDICDLLARQNLHGLGAGVYPTREATPWPAHPNTLSFVVAVFDEEVTSTDRAGRETSVQALQRLAPEIRAGVLGPTKAGYFDQGLLSRGMIRSKVGSVRERLRRRGAVA